MDFQTVTASEPNAFVGQHHSRYTIRRVSSITSPVLVEQSFSINFDRRRPFIPGIVCGLIGFLIINVTIVMALRKYSRWRSRQNRIRHLKYIGLFTIQWMVVYSGKANVLSYWKFPSFIYGESASNYYDVTWNAMVAARLPTRNAFEYIWGESIHGDMDHKDSHRLLSICWICTCWWI